MSNLITPHKPEAPDWGVIVTLLKRKSGISYVKLASKMGLSVGTLHGIAGGKLITRMHCTTGDTIRLWAKANFTADEKARCRL